MKLTVVLNQGEDGFLIGQIKEIPEVLTQGETEAEVLENIQDALDLYLEHMRESFEEENTEIESTETELVFTQA